MIREMILLIIIGAVLAGTLAAITGGVRMFPPVMALAVAILAASALTANLAAYLSERKKRNDTSKKRDQ